MTEPTDPNGQTQPPAGNDQTDYKAQYLDLSAKIANGEYVPKNVYAGLQTKHEKEVLAHKADVEALNAANQKVTDLDVTLKTLQGKVTEFEGTLGTTTTELTTTKAENSRLKLIMGKFPSLVEFEGKGLLPTAATEEELTQKLTAFLETIGAAQQQQKETKLAGASQPPAGKDTNTNPSAKQLLNEAMALQRKGDIAGYNAKMDEYYKLPAS